MLWPTSRRRSTRFGRSGLFRTVAAATVLMMRVVSGTAETSCKSVTAPEVWPTIFKEAAEEEGSSWKLAVHQILAGVVLTLTILGCGGCLDCRRTRTLCTKSTQSQVKYTWHLATPRFQPVPLYEQGGWLESESTSKRSIW